MKEIISGLLRTTQQAGKRFKEMTEFEKTIIELIKWIGYAGIIYGTSRGIILAVSKALKKLEDISHKPIIKAMEDMQESINGRLDKTDKKIEELDEKVNRSLEINAANAELALSMADETGEHGATNGRTRESASKLREIIYKNVKE